MCALYKGCWFTVLSSTLGVFGIFRDLVYNTGLRVQTAAHSSELEMTSLCFTVLNKSLRYVEGILEKFCLLFMSNCLLVFQSHLGVNCEVPVPRLPRTALRMCIILVEYRYGIVHFVKMVFFVY